MSLNTLRGFMTSRRANVRRRLLVLSLLVALQGVSAAFFVGDVFVDIASIGMDTHTLFEAQATVALVLGVVFGSIEMWRTLVRQLRAENALRIASGSFAEMIEERFADWSLSSSEAEVALLTLKGFDTSEIAEMRNTAKGTVRVQLANIYAKAGWHNRGQFVSSFLDDLLDQPVTGAAPSRGQSRDSLPD